MAELDRADEGGVHRVRSLLRQLVHSFAHAHSEAQATLRRKQRSQDIHALGDRQREQIPPCFDDHWDQALRERRQKGRGKHRRGSNAESGRRLLRRLEKNHDGMRSAATRQHDMQIDQAMKYLSLDVANFLEQGPQMAELPCV
jgi:molybdenum-dependent DNA-binding transcriptional regulator ModE